jgi:hypothetical protein
MTAVPPYLLVFVAAVSLSGAWPAHALAQSAPPPAVATQQPAANPRTGASDGAASLQDVARRISEVISDHAGKVAAPSVEITPRPEPAKPKPAVAKRPPLPRKPSSLVSLKWDPALTSTGVALAWDDQLNPRRPRADLGVRLVWPAK